MTAEKLNNVIKLSRKFEKKLSLAWPIIIGLYFALSILVSIMNFLKMLEVGHGVLEEVITPVTWSIYALGILAVYFTYLIIQRRNWHFAKMYFIFSETLKIISIKPLANDLQLKVSLIKNMLEEVRGEEKPRNVFLWIIASAISFGLFGLLASYIVHNDFYKHSKREERMISLFSELSVFGSEVKTYVIKKRSILHLVLSILSAGLYAPIWIYMFISDFNKHIGEHKIMDEYLKRFLEEL